MHREKKVSALRKMQNISGGIPEDELPTVAYVVPPLSQKTSVTSAPVANMEDKQQLSAEEVCSTIFRSSQSLSTRRDGGVPGCSQLQLSQSCSSAAPSPNDYSRSSISSSDSCNSWRKKASHPPLCHRAAQHDHYKESPHNSSCGAVFEKSRCTSMVMSNASNASLTKADYHDQNVISDNDSHQRNYYWNPFPSASDGEHVVDASRSPRSPDALLGGYADAVRSAPHARPTSSKWNDAEKWLTANINCTGFANNTVGLLGKSCNADSMPPPPEEPNHDRPPNKPTMLISLSNIQQTPRLMAEAQHVQCDGAPRLTTSKDNCASPNCNLKQTCPALDCQPSLAWSNEQSRAVNADSNPLNDECRQCRVLTARLNHVFAKSGHPMMTGHVAQCITDTATRGRSISRNNHVAGRAVAAEAVHCTNCGGGRRPAIST